MSFCPGAVAGMSDGKANNNGAGQQTGYEAATIIRRFPPRVGNGRRLEAAKNGGGSGIRTLGTLTRTTVFEFDHRCAGWCALVLNCVDTFANSRIEISVDAASCHPVIGSSLAIWFAISMTVP